MPQRFRSLKVFLHLSRRKKTTNATPDAYAQMRVTQVRQDYALGERVRRRSKSRWQDVFDPAQRDSGMALLSVGVLLYSPPICPIVAKVSKHRAFYGTEAVKVGPNPRCSKNDFRILERA